MVVTELVISRKKMLSIVVILALMLAGAVVYTTMARGPTSTKATVDEILRVTSERGDYMPEYFIVSRTSPFFALMCTPAALYYDSSGRRIAVPMLIAGNDAETQEHGVSKGVLRFIEAYGGKNGALLGPLSKDEIKQIEAVAGADFNWKYIKPGLRDASIYLAESMWKRADAVLVIKADMNGYKLGVNAVLIASYLNIPVYTVNKIDSKVKNSFNKLHVKYTIICGDLEGYGKVYRFRNDSEIWSLVATGKYTGGKSILRNNLGIEQPNYLVIANPMDAFPAQVLDSFTKTFEGKVKSQDTGSTSDPSLDPDAPKHYIIIPQDYEFANVKLETFMEFTTPVIPNHTPDDDGERCYTYFGIDADEDGVMIDDEDSDVDCLEFFTPSLAYENVVNSEGISVKAHGYGEKPIFHAQGKHCISILATLHISPSDYINILPPPETTYQIKVTIEKLSSANYPLIENASSMAPYIAAFRHGIVIAQDDFSIYSDEKLLKSKRCGDPAANPDLIVLNNRRVFHIKETIHGVLADLLGMGSVDKSSLAQRIANSNTTMYLAIVADTNMVPWYLFPTEGQIDQPQQGWGVGGDCAYANIDMEFVTKSTELEPETFELAVGRIVGWDIQDVSALIARTLFYNDIIDQFEGHSGSWKNCAMTTFGSKVPVGTAKTVTEKIDAALQQAGFTVDSSHDVALSHRKYSGPYWERSNFIMFCAHGFYYWFVPPGYRPDGVGGGFDVAHVKDMNFGPGIVFGVSCVTGKIDGIEPYNSIALTFLHSGMNVYIGSSRLAWGSLAMNPASDSNEEYGAYLGLLFYGYLTGYLYDKHGGLISAGKGDYTVGEAFMLAKNKFYEMQGSDKGGPNDDTIGEFNLFGDPAFNPYEPNHNG